MKVLFVRHGQTKTNLKGIVPKKGEDISLDETGISQAEKLAAVLKKRRYESNFLLSGKQGFRDSQYYS